MHWLSKLDFEKVYFQSRQEVSTINCENEGLCQQNSYLKEQEIVLKFKPHSRKNCQPRRWKQWCWSSCCLESPGGHSDSDPAGAGPERIARDFLQKCGLINKSSPSISSVPIIPNFCHLSPVKFPKKISTTPSIIGLRKGHQPLRHHGPRLAIGSQPGVQRLLVPHGHRGVQPAARHQGLHGAAAAHRPEG